MVVNIEPRPVRPRWWSVALVAGGMFVFGWWLVSLTIKPPPSGLVETYSPRVVSESESDSEFRTGIESDESGTEADTETERDTESEPDTESETETDTEAEADSDDDDPDTQRERTTAASPRTAATSETTPSEREYRLRRGRLAYIQCAGLERANGRCPRDRNFEDAMWQVLTDLSACPQITRPGSSDVRVRFEAGETTVRFRDWGTDPFPLEDLSTCLTEPVRALSSDLAADPLVVSFRFRLIGR